LQRPNDRGHTAAEPVSLQWAAGAAIPTQRETKCYFVFFF
jgi:hypothetical protein